MVRKIKRKRGFPQTKRRFPRFLERFYMSPTAEALELCPGGSPEKSGRRCMKHYSGLSALAESPRPHPVCFSGCSESLGLKGHAGWDSGWS